MAAPRLVKDIMTTGVISIESTERLSRAIQLMTERNISCVIVKNGPDVVGIITERDLLRRVLAVGADPKNLSAEEVMTRTVTTISQEATLEEGMRVIESMKVRRLPVIAKDGIVGLITQTDIVNETYNIHKHNLKMAFHQNLQSYIIIATTIFFCLIFLYRFIS